MSNIALNWMFGSRAGRHIESKTREVWGRVRVNSEAGPLATEECTLQDCKPFQLIRARWAVDEAL